MSSRFVNPVGQGLGGCQNWTLTFLFMSISDFLVMITIVLTLVTIAVSNNKKIWLYKFYKRDFFLLSLAVLWIHYLMAFSWFEQKNLFIARRLIMEKGIPADVWAYIVSLLMLVSLIYIIGWRKTFPCSRHESVINYYKRLINGNIGLLVEYLEDYHKDKIQKNICDINKRIEKEDKEEPCEVKNNKSKKKSSKHLDGLVLQNIIFLPEFIEKSSSINPIFFLECVYQLKTDRIYGAEDSIHFYFRNLMRIKSINFVREMTDPLNYKEESNIEYELRDTSFLSKMFSYMDFITELKVFRAFGEEALQEANMGNRIFSFEVDEFHNHEYYQTSCYLCLRFYDILLRRIIALSDSDSEKQNFIYPYYLKLICSSLVDKYYQYGDESYAMKYIDDVSGNIHQWLDCIAKKGIASYTYDLVEILAQIHKEKTNDIYTLESVRKVIKEFRGFSKDYGRESPMIVSFWKYIENLNISESQLLHRASDSILTKEDLFYGDFQKLKKDQ